MYRTILGGLALALLSLVSGCSRLTRTETVAASDAQLPLPDSQTITVPPNSPKLAQIRVETVAMKPMPVDEVVAPGKVETNPHRVSHVIMPVSGRVRQVLVRLGDPVSEGQSLFTVDSPEAGAATSAHRQALSKVRECESTLSKAKADLARISELVERGAAPLKELIAAKNDLALAESGLEQAQAAQDESEHRLEVLGLDPQHPAQEVTVRAPLAGKIIEIAVVPGEYRNDMSASLMTIADLRSVWISADVPESAIRLVRAGENVQVELYAYPGEVFHARVMRIADMVDPQTRTIKVQAEIGNPDGRLRPEMFGQIRHSHSVQPAAVLPAGAVLQKDGRNVVLREESAGTFREVEVRTGTPSGDLLPVKSGVKAGDRVVVDGAMLLAR